MPLPFTFGSVTVIQDQPSMLPDRPTVPIKATCEVCGAAIKWTADPDDEVELRDLADRVRRNMCPARGHGAYEV